MEVQPSSLSFLLDALQGQGLPTWAEPRPLGAPGAVPGAPRLPRCLAAHVDTSPSPHRTGPIGPLQTINSGLGFPTSQECSPGSLASIPRRAGWHLAPLACGEGCSRPLPPAQSREPWSRPVRPQGRRDPPATQALPHSEKDHMAPRAEHLHPLIDSHATPVAGSPFGR